MAAVTLSNNALSEDELATYHQQGLLRPNFRFSQTMQENLNDLADQTLQATEGQRPESINCPHLEDWIGLPPELSQQWLDIAGLPEIVDRVASVLGPDIILWGSQLFCKPAVTGMEVPWHQDGDYWPIKPLTTCTVWLAIDDATPENGCMRYIPGSHSQRKIFPHNIDDRPDLVLSQVTGGDYFDESTAQDDVLMAGEFSIHDVYLIHGSQPNRSGNRRAALVLRYMSAAESLYDRSMDLDGGTQHYQTRFSIRPIFLVRGQQHANDDELISKHPNYQA